MSTKSTGILQRSSALDAFRGYSILTMVLSGSIAYGILPGWMYHAQVPPPAHQFDPAIFGISWVDLVFPFFLFAMGAAFPFSIGKKLNEKGEIYKALLNAAGRGLQLTFFAIYIQHLYPYVISEPQDIKAWMISLFAFALMFPMYMRLPEKISKPVRIGIKMAAYLVGIGLLLTVNYANNRTFSLAYSNIIILLLANMAIFGSLAYIFTYKNKFARLAILPFIMAVFLGSSNEGSWTHWLFNFTPLPWMYNFSYLKYLFIILPGTIAGEYLMDWIKKGESDATQIHSEKRTAFWMMALSPVIVITNLYCLYTRLLVLNLFFTAGLLLWGIYLLREATSRFRLLWKNLFFAGAYFLMLGLFFEAFEGGIRKDHATYSYYFVTSGLAFISLVFFSVVCDFFKWERQSQFLTMSGKNPMIAYVASTMVIYPVFSIFGITSFMSFFSTNPWLGFLQGIIITALTTLITIFFTKINWIWRT